MGGGFRNFSGLLPPADPPILPHPIAARCGRRGSPFRVFVVPAKTGSNKTYQNHRLTVHLT